MENEKDMNESKEALSGKGVFSFNKRQARGNTTQLQNKSRGDTERLFCFSYHARKKE